MRKIFNGIILTLVTILIVAIPVLADVYTATIQVTETSGNSYTDYPFSVTMNNDYLASNGFILSSGLDTRVELAGVAQPHLMVDDRTLFVTDITASSSNNFQFVTGQTPLADMPIIVGNNGYVTISDAAALEMDDEFEVEIDGYINTTLGYGSYLEKEGAIRIYNSASGEITADILTTPSSYAVVESSSGGTDSIDTEHDLTYPTGVNADDILIFVIVIDGWNDAIETWPTGWTGLFEGNYSTNLAMGIGYKTANGTESGTLTVDTSGSKACAWQMYRISGSTGSVDIAATYNTGNSVNPDPTSCTADWGSATNLWIALAGTDWNATVSSNPASYTGIRNDTDSNCGLASAYYENTTDTENPGTYTMSGANNWVAVTIVIRPDYDVDKTVVITGLSDEEQTLTVTADTTNFYISVDGSTPGGAETVALSGSSVVDNANDYIWLNDNSIPYANYITLDVGGAEVVKYQPATIIIGTTLPDLTGAAQNGDITWGSNPSGISVTLSSFVSESQPTYTQLPTEPQDVVSTIEQPAWFNPTGSLLTNPLYPVVKAVSDNTGFTVPQIWLAFATMLVLAGMLVTLKFLPHLAIVSAVGGGLSGFFVQMEIYPFWVIFLFVVGFIAGLIMERTPAL